MNTHEGYSKTTLDNTQILLAGGGHKPFTDFIGSIQYNSTSKILQYRNPYSDPQNPPNWLNIVALDWSVNKNGDSRFILHNQGIWTRILQFTITAGRYDPTISFRWHPTECDRDIWADFNINIRLDLPAQNNINDEIKFYAVYHGIAVKTLRCVKENNTTFSVWVEGVKSTSSWSPYGLLQIVSTYAINSYVTEVIYSDDISEYSYVEPTLGGIVNYANTANNANYISTVLTNSSSNHYLTFVNSNNSSASYEALYTNSDLYYKPSSHKLYVNKLYTSSEIEVNGTARFYNDVKCSASFEVTGTSRIKGELYVTSTAHFQANIDAYDIYPHSKNTYDLGTPSKYWKELFVGGNGNSGSGHIWYGRDWGTGKQYSFGIDGLIMYQDVEETSGIQFNGDYINMWSPCNSYSLRYWDENNGNEIWNIDASGNFSGNASTATKASLDNDGNAFKSYYLRKVSVPNNTTNDFNTFENMTLTGRGDPTTSASLSHAPWAGSGPAGGYGVLTYLWSGYGILMAWGYNNNHIYIRNKYYNNSAVWSDSWSTVALTSDLSGYLTSQDHYKTSITAGTAGTSSATSGSTLSVPYVTVNANGHVTGYGTHTHTISGFLTTLDHYKTSITAGTAGTSSDTSGATLAVPYVSMNANGHVTGYGTHTHSVTAVVGSYTSNGGQQNPNYFGTNRVGFLMMNTTVNNNSLYKDWMIMDCYGGNDVGGGVAIGVNRQSLGAYIMRSAAARTSWAESAELIGTHNYTTYCATSGHNHDDIYLKLSGGTMSGLITTTSGSSHSGIKVGDTYINAIGGELIFQNNTAIRFGGDSWDWNVWAELGYAHSSKIVYLGLSGSPYTTNSTQTGGKIYTPGISDIYIGNGTYKVWHEGNDGSGSGLDADTVDGYHFSDLESRYVNTTGDIMTGGILMSSMEASGKRWMYGVTRNSGFKYDYAGNESFIISSGTYSLSSISFYTSNRLSMNDSTGQWNSVTPDMRIKDTRVSINSDINTSYQLYVNGSTYSTGYYRANSSDSYVLLGGGGHKLITDLISNGTYQCLAYYSSSTKISSANSLKYTPDPGYLTVGDEAWISGNCIGFIDGMNIRFYDDSDDADPTDFPYIHDNISLFSGGNATIFDSYQPIVISNDIRLIDPTNYGWKDLYANNGTFCGTLSASTGTFIGTLSALNNKFYVNSSGAFWTSDIRAKKDIHQITKEEVDKLFSTPDGYLKGFTFKDGDIKSFGVIAQEIIEYCPECIDEGELLHVNYDVALSKIMAGMYLKIKELEKEIEILRNH